MLMSSDTRFFPSLKASDYPTDVVDCKKKPTALLQ